VSSTAPDIRMSAQVREVLDDEMIRHSLGAPLARARCPVCREPVPPTGPVNVVVIVGGRVQAITFAHLSCAPSAVMMRPAAPVSLSGELDIMMTAMLMQDDSGPLTALCAELKSPAYLRSLTPGGERTNVGMSEALLRGFEPLSRLDQVPIRQLDWPATITDTGGEIWRLLINPTPLFYEGDVQALPGWREVTAWRGWCVLYTGTGFSDPETGRLTVERLEAAALAGTLAAARLRIMWAPMP
jgi:hypothetical protein